MAFPAGGARTLVRRRREPPVWEFGQLRIRRIAQADHDAALALHREARARVGLRPGDGVYYEHDLFRIDEVYLGAGGEFLVGIRAGGLVALGGLRRIDGEKAEMVRLCVGPAVLRHGYGAAMLMALEERAVELGYRTLRGDTTAMQGAALELYLRSGWQETGRETINGIENIYGEKRL